MNSSNPTKSNNDGGDIKVSVREFIERIMDERDRLYDIRFKAAETAVSAALSAQEKAVSAAFAASEKAVLKAEEAQKEYNIRSNEFRGQLDDQAKTLMPRNECLTMFRNMEDKVVLTNKDIASLRESRSEGGGKAAGIHLVWIVLVALIGIVIALANYFRR